MFGGKRETVSTEYRIVKHNDKLFAVFSDVTTKDHLGELRTYSNFCGETGTIEGAENMIMKLKRYSK